MTAAIGVPGGLLPVKMKGHVFVPPLLIIAWRIAVGYALGWDMGSGTGRMDG